MSAPLLYLSWALGIFLSLPIVIICVISTWELYTHIWEGIRDWWKPRFPTSK